MNKKDLAKYKEQFCRVLVKKRNEYDCVFCTVEVVNDRQVYVTDTRGAWFKIPIESIKGIHVNEEQW
jgi:hypothetical protein